jgi:predicted lactoylglutathione lyase
VISPYDKNPASVGNGSMVALIMDSKEKVDRLHRKALELGGKDEGSPGQRGEGFYAGYFRDLDGNKLNASSWVDKDCRAARAAGRAPSVPDTDPRRSAR